MGRTTPAAHATRNPGRAVQLSRSRHRLSTAAKATKALTAAHNKEKKLAFYADIDKHFMEVTASIIEIAKKHGKKEKTVRAIVSSRTQFKAQRAPSLRNAIIHDMAAKAHVAGRYR
jgi:hypothetical protein